MAKGELISRKDAIKAAIYAVYEADRDGRMFKEVLEEEIMKLPGHRRGTTVECMLEVCKYNKNCRCTNKKIELAEEHYCCGGCDDGWVFPEEEDDD